MWRFLVRDEVTHRLVVVDEPAISAGSWSKCSALWEEPGLFESSRGGSRDSGDVVLEVRPDYGVIVREGGNWQFASNFSASLLGSFHVVSPFHERSCLFNKPQHSGKA